jgi:hypothetical protein
MLAALDRASVTRRTVIGQHSCPCQRRARSARCVCSAYIFWAIADPLGSGLIESFARRVGVVYNSPIRLAGQLESTRLTAGALGMTSCHSTCGPPGDADPLVATAL